MPKVKPPKMTPAEQSAKFKEMARQLGADESPEAFEKTLKQVAKEKPKRP